MKPPLTIPNLPPLVAQGSRLKPLLPKDIVLFGRRGFSPELLSPELLSSMR
jgi:hypothetical protein